MHTILDTAGQPAHDAFVEKKSEFIGDACHIDTLDEALAFVEAIRQQHPKSRHVAYAAVCGGADGRLSERMSDDGEPSGTAGKPILDVLRANELTDCVVAVTRYFGGILLGSGGLIRAYSTGASLAVKAASQARIVPCVRYSVRLEYPQLAIFQRLLADCEGRSDDERYTDRVTLRAIVPQERSETFESRTREAFNASVTPERLDVVNHPVAL
ncbi:MAG: YigZ family protein [Bifidobacterium scardovii]|uniref:IMPACT family protein n=1 Tax=Bifidobacterium scardovii TaxID=158787 RepID=UPI00066705E7|nr:YigZ family protein [Bifidobacterium scardovii]MBS6948435.1 YigZ family protein [Bifidobacterium scardovii]MDU3737188.1 YigZ family protein [Bifidobacterium scardovii]MDU5297268.1 YigZ family protein [Bifidobacterium scardovii]MDU5611178.1 YigZ family protein [Bifidobacterium scardovii]MDU5888068.1 YigZ family protein [Bifidobacterium scardovii]